MGCKTWLKLSVLVCAGATLVGCNNTNPNRSVASNTPVPNANTKMPAAFPVANGQKVQSTADPNVPTSFTNNTQQFPANSSAGSRGSVTPANYTPSSIGSTPALPPVPPTANSSSPFLVPSIPPSPGSSNFGNMRDTVPPSSPGSNPFASPPGSPSSSFQPSPSSPSTGFSPAALPLNPNLPPAPSFPQRP